MKRVLIAEDDPDTAAAIGATLEEHLSVSTTQVTNGALVLDQITAAPPDLLILDINLPGLNGVDVFDLIRANRSLKDVPILFLTATPDRARRAFAGGEARDIMRKPFAADDLVGRVEKLLARAEKVA